MTTKTPEVEDLNVKLNLKPHEKIISEEWSSHIPAENRFVGSMGNLAITDQRIVYEPCWMSIFGDVLEISLQDVLSVSPAYIYRIHPVVLIETLSVQSIHFGSSSQQRLVNMINLAKSYANDAIPDASNPNP